MSLSEMLLGNFAIISGGRDAITATIFMLWEVKTEFQ